MFMEGGFIPVIINARRTKLQMFLSLAALALRKLAAECPSIRPRMPGNLARRKVQSRVLFGASRVAVVSFRVLGEQDAGRESPVPQLAVRIAALIRSEVTRDCEQSIVRPFTRNVASSRSKRNVRRSVRRKAEAGTRQVRRNLETGTATAGRGRSWSGAP